METRAEIESMRVADLREFLKRHGQVPHVVTRGNGTPGAPRKADLQRAALAIESAARSNTTEALATDPVLAPYSPTRHNAPKPNPFQSRIPSPGNRVQIQTNDLTEETGRSRERDAAIAQRVATPARPMERERKRRSSGTWIDPLLLTPKSKRTPIAPREKRTPVVRNDNVSNVRNVPNAARVQATQPIPLHADQPVLEPPPLPQNGVPFGEILLPEDNEEDADFGENQARMLDDADIDKQVHDDELFDVSILEEDRRDEIIPSDIEHVPNSEDESTVGTDGEGDSGQNFNGWGLENFRVWLEKHGVRYSEEASRSELLSLARAHSLQMEMEAERAQMEKKRGRRGRRRRIISAPVADDDVAEGDVVTVPLEQRRRPPRTRNAKKVEKRNILDALLKRFVRIPWTYVLTLMTFALVMAIAFSVINVYHNHTKPFCDTGKTSSKVEEGYGCRRCPNYGICELGELSCEPGYAIVRKVCVEDQESSIMAEEIARDANMFLAQQAGLAECGEIASAGLSISELRESLRILASEKSKGSFFPLAGRTYSPEKFDLAYAKALIRLTDGEDFPNISVGLEGYYASAVATYSFRCLAKLFILRNLSAIGVIIVIFLCAVYVKISLYFRKLDQMKLDAAYSKALELLRDQKGNYIRQEEEFAFIQDVALRQEVLGFQSPQVIQFWKRVEVLLKNDNRLAYRANWAVKGMPSNTYEWRSRISRNSGVFSSGGSLRDADSPATSVGADMDGVFSTPGSTWLDAVRTRLFNPHT